MIVCALHNVCFNDADCIYTRLSRIALQHSVNHFVQGPQQIEYLKEHSDMACLLYGALKIQPPAISAASLQRESLNLSDYDHDQDTCRPQSSSWHVHLNHAYQCRY